MTTPNTPNPFLARYREEAERATDAPHQMGKSPMKFTEKTMNVVVAAADLWSVSADRPTLARAERSIFEALTPTTTLVLIDQNERMPVAWCPDESWARDYLETAPHPEELSLWEISREGDPAKDITIDFCDRWLEQVADYTEDEETFRDRLPAFVQAHFEDEALERYRNGRVAK